VFFLIKDTLDVMEHVFSSFKFNGGVFVTVFRIGYCIGADLHIVI